MFTSIVVPLDLEEQGGDRALPLAGRLATAAGLPIDLVTVSSPNLPEECDRYELERRGAVLGVPTQATVLHSNDPASALIDWLEAHPGALPVMATHARGVFTQRLFGSVSEALLARFRGPVVLVGPHFEAGGSDGAPPVLVVSAQDEAVAEAARAWTATFASPATVAPSAMPGTQAAAVTQLADDFGDVVVALSSRRWRDPAHRHLASVARSVTQGCRRAVLVVPA